MRPQQRKSTIDDSYPLSPMQQGMLFHSLLAPEAGVDIQQLYCELHEALDVTAFKRSWQRVIERHPVLRTSFCWQDVAEPLQKVHSVVNLPWEEQDWRNVPHNKKKERLAAFLISDRRRGFNMTQAPLLRLILVHWDDADSRLIWTSHHALFDGGSRAPLLREVFAFYEAFRSGTELELPLPRPYRDYIDWLQQQDFSQAESFWRQTLKGFSAPTPLVVDHVARTGDDEGTRQGALEVCLSSEITTTLRTLANENQLTLNTFVQGAWALLLNRYSGQDEVVFGATRACRRSTVEGADAMVGIFINTLPLRVRANPKSELLPWLKELRAQWMAMRDYEHTPLAKVQGWCDVPGGTSLFDSIVVFENFHLDSLLRTQGGSWSNRQFRLFEKTNYPITLAAYAETELCLEIGFDRSRFDDATIKRMLAHLQTLLEGMASQPQGRLGDLSLLTPAERLQLLVEWNDTAADYPRDKCIHELFEEQVKKTPEAVAIVFEGQEVTYHELNRRANQLAHHLRNMGVGRDVLVGVYLERSLEMVVALIGVLKAGGAYVAVDTNHPADRVQYMLSDAAVALIITHGKLASQLAGYEGRMVMLDVAPFEIGMDCDVDLGGRVTADNAVYVLYTSGSTGKPKGVVITHRSLCNYIHWMANSFPLTLDDAVLQMTLLSFDPSVYDIFTPLITGARLVIARPLGHSDPAYLIDIIQQQQITTMTLVPAQLRMLVEEPAFSHCTSLRRMFVGGEALPGNLVQSAAGLVPAEIYNVYGLTETTIDATSFKYGRNDHGKTVPIGRPIANTKVYVLDVHGTPVPIGVPGELYIGGDGVARGYLNRPELTADKFLRDPFSAVPGSRMYRTGDQVRWRADGNLEFLSRFDHQVKLHGFRIELGEVEAVLMQHPRVLQAVVLLREDRPGDKRLAAYLVPQSALAHPAPDELRRHLHDRLPEYMVPSAFVFLDTLPLTPNGKVDRKALPAPDRAGVEDGYVAPRNAVEESLADIWSEVLGIERIGIHDNFFALGGHSLLAARLCVEMEKKLGCRIPLALFLGAANIESLANTIPEERSSQSRLAIVPLQSSGRRAPLFLMPSISGSPLSWKNVVDRLDAERPVFAVGVAGQTPPWPEQTTLPEIASHFAGALREARVAGPLHIMGYSFGGMLAYEVARQLHDAGVEVGLVAVIDTGPEQFCAHAQWPDVRNLLRFLANMPAWISQFAFKTTTSQKVYELRRKLRTWGRRLQAMLTGEPAITQLDDVIDTRRVPEDFRRRMQTNHDALECYVPGAYAGRLALFRATIRPLLHSFTPDLNWRQVVTGGVDVVDIPGNHDTILRQPNSDILADRLQVVLDTV